MALTKCKECKKEISEKAKSCPHCGAPIKKISGCGCLTIQFLIIGAIIFIVGERYSNKTQPITPQQTREQQIKKYFSPWDGSHRGLTKVIKKSMNDPESYQHEQTNYWDKGNYLLVKTTFRGIVKNTITAKVDLNGHVIEILTKP